MSSAGSGGPIQPTRPGDPSRVGPYRVVGRLGAGGMGTVYAALADSGQRVAVKVVHPVHAGDPEFRARFRREIRLCARVQGPFVLALLAADADAETPWLATEYAAGPTLSQHLAAHGPLAGAALHAFAAGTAQALVTIHGAGVVHRDVKPQNVLLSPAGPRMLDFGIAHAADGTSVTRTGVLTGTPGWISPEHYRDGVTAAPGDLFAWGALVAHAATGRPVFGSGAPEAVAYRVMSGRPDVEGVPEALKEVLERALAKDPDERPKAAEAAEACVRLLAAGSTEVLARHDTARTLRDPSVIDELITAQWSVPAPHDDPWPQPLAAAVKSSRRRAVVAVLVAAAVVGACVGGAAALRGGDGRRTGAKEPAAAAASSETAVSAAGSDRPRSAADGAGTAGRTAADPRAIPVPTDPLAGVAHAAFTRADDLTQPMPGEWSASHGARDAAEQDVATAVRDRITAMLATKDMSFMAPTVTFNRQAQTVMVTGGPISTLTDDYKEVFRRAGELAACITLAHRLQDAPTSWPYGRFSVYWKDYDGQDEATVLGFGKATDGCYTEEAGQRQATEEGIVTARFPSSDKEEIRLAAGTVKAVTAAWNARVAEGHGLEPFARDDAITLGFDPVENMMYVWAYDDAGALAGRAQQAHFQDVVGKVVCPRLLAEYNTDKHWTYTHWAIAAYQGNNASPQLFTAGDCLPTGRP
ncbi:serine/threonine-protein kinase [Streptomyces scabiei]|uniref:serine/threonine-protein kinase n=1 Tax=Streptomyces scabiei TaxID=1930 RepID=UPI0029A8666E|nr:serine/threonine-protein kinase [Streptomyces scabiei]MDX3115753.1 serine/threonine-protein kinase [Streptomyces scabiei]